MNGKFPGEADPFSGQTASVADELYLLAEGLCNGTLSPGQRDRLEAWIAADEEAKKFCAFYLALHAMLRWRHRPLPTSDAAGGGGRSERSFPRSGHGL